MPRHMLRLTLVLGVLITILGSTGVFAVFTDVATGGTNLVTSGARPSAADIRIATASAVNNTTTCGTFVDGTTTPQFTVADLQPDGAATTSYVCLSNAGAATVSIVATATNLTDVDRLCTGDEESAGDTSCGGDQEGELSRVVNVTIQQVSCSTGATVSGAQIALDQLPAFPIGLSSTGLAPLTIACVRLVVEYNRDASEAYIQIAQSDNATWNFLFEATAA